MRLVACDNEVDLRRNSLSLVWEAMEHYARLGDIADIHSGLTYEHGSSSLCVSNDSGTGYAPGVHKLDNYLEAFIMTDYQYLCATPERIAVQRSGLRSQGSKVLINRVRYSRGYWSMAGGIDTQNLIFSQQYHGMWPKNDIALELLAALVNCPVANAYLFLYRTERDNQIRFINQIPVPSFTDEQTALIVSLVQEYYSQRGQWLVTEHLAEQFESRCRTLLYQIDAAVLEAYALPAERERELLRVFDGVPRRPLPFEFPGYGDDYERAKVELQEEKAYRGVLRRYHELVDKEFLDGITESEAIEQEKLRQQIDAHNAPFYEPILSELEAEKL